MATIALDKTTTGAEQISPPVPTIPKPRLAYSMRGAAEQISVSYMTMHRLIKIGKIKSSGDMRTKIIPHTELERFLKETVA